MGKFYDDLKEGFEDILAHRKGKITLRKECKKIEELINHPFAGLTREHRDHREKINPPSVSSVLSSERSERVVK